VEDSLWIEDGNDLRLQESTWGAENMTRVEAVPRIAADVAVLPSLSLLLAGGTPWWLKFFWFA